MVENHGHYNHGLLGVLRPGRTGAEALKAFVVPKPGASHDEAALAAHCRAALAGFKVPHSYEWIAELPRNPAGKVLKSCPPFKPGDIATAAVEIFAEDGDGLSEESFVSHVQRHHPPEVVVAALRYAGLQCRSIAGQHPGAQLEDGADDERHIKLVYFAKRNDHHDAWR